MLVTLNLFRQNHYARRCYSLTMSTPAGLDKFLSAQKAARDERALEKKKETSVVLIQSRIRGYLARKAYRAQAVTDLDLLLGQEADETNVTVFLVASRFLSVSSSVPPQKEAAAAFRDRFERLCKYLVRSVETSDSARVSYVGVALNPKHSLDWIRHIKVLLGKCCDALEQLKPDLHVDSVSLALQLHTLIVFTSPNSWLLLQRNKQLSPLVPGMNQMCSNILGALVQRGFFSTLKQVLFKGVCRNNVCLKPVSLVAILSLATRPLTSGGFTENLLLQFTRHVLTVPALVHQIEALTPDHMNKWADMELLPKVIQLLANDQAMTTLVGSVQGTQILALLANIIHLFNVSPIHTAMDLGFPNFTVSNYSVLKYHVHS